jgi:hypothetical protein
MAKFTISGKDVQMDTEDALMFVGKALAIGSNGYVRLLRGGGQRYVHRIIMAAEENEQVDHINGDRLDNRRENLRICTAAENSFNKVIGTRNKSGVVGVHWDSKRLRWAAQICIGGKTIPLGRFDDLEKAKAVRLAAETSYHGQFAGHLGARS